MACAPLLLHVKGNIDYNTSKVVSIVGTRQITSYGKEVVRHLMQGLRAYQGLLIVSGLAYGVDIHVHRHALAQGIPTVAVLPSGIEAIYPAAHQRTAAEMILHQGGMISEYAKDTKVETFHFPARNRIIAGLSDATIVVEAPKKSGALITAKQADEYNRVVFAVPGRLGERCSEGCLRLIKNHEAMVLTSAEDIADYFNWEKKEQAGLQLPSLEQRGVLTEQEKAAVKTLARLSKAVDLETWGKAAGIGIEALSTMVLQLELKEVIKSLPGGKYTLVAG